MKGKFKNTYPKFNASTGKRTDVYVYEITGTDEEISQYEADQADNLRTDDETGNHLLFLQDYSGENIDVKRSVKTGRYYPDQSAFTKMNSLAKQYGGNLGDAIANEAAKDLLRGVFNTSSAQSRSPKAANSTDTVVEASKEVLISNEEVIEEQD